MTRASAFFQKLILTRVTAHADRLSQVPAGIGQEWLGLHVRNVKAGSFSWHSWGLKKWIENINISPIFLSL